MRETRRVALPALLGFLMLAAGCSSANEFAQTTTAVSTAQTETSVADAEPVSTTESPTSGSVSVGDIPDQLKAGAWTIDLGTLAIKLVSDEPMDVAGVASGELLLGLSDSSDPSFFHGFGVFELKSLINATTGGVMIERLRPAADLGPWLDSLDELTVLKSGEAELAGNPASWWRFDVDGSCSSCFQFFFLPEEAPDQGFTAVFLGLAGRSGPSNWKTG